MEEMNNTSMPNGSQDKKGFAIASLVLGIVSVVFMCVWYLGIPAAILGLIFGIIANKAKKNGMATAGIVLSIIGLVLVVILIILAAIGLSMGFMDAIMG